MRPSTYRRVVALTVAVTVGVLGAPLAPAAQAKDAVVPAKRAAQWQAGELTRGLMHNDQYGVDDYGLTIDSLQAMRAAKVVPAKRKRILQALRKNVGNYISDGSGGTFAGSAAKMLVAARGAKPRSFGGVNLVARTRSLVDQSGADRGRIVDDSDSDHSNLVAQAYALQGLAGVGKKAPAVKRFLLKQQCNRGFFRMLYNDKASNPTLRCSTAKPSNRTADLDATAIALTAMASARRDGVRGLAKPIAKTSRWLRNKQRRNGSFVGSQPKRANTNSTGLAGYALAQVGRQAAAHRAAVWVASRQATPRRARGNKLRRDIGAIAFSDAVLRKGRKNGITNPARDQWRRSSTQATLGLLGLQRKRFQTRVSKRRVPAGAKLRVRARRLAPGEKYTVTVAGRAVAHGRAGAKGRLRERVRIPRKVRPGRRIVKVHGAVGVRAGQHRIRVRTNRSAAAAAPAAAKKKRRGYPGRCKRKHRKGVTVAVDFRSLGKFRKHKGRKIVRCAPPRFTKRGKLKKRTGLKALRHAGIKFRGTRLSGRAYVCRIQGRPARKERIKIRGNPNYREKCVRTPPPSAFWAYWRARGKKGSGGWKFNRTGAANRYVIPGGYEGWSFARNAKKGKFPKPRVRPR